MCKGEVPKAVKKLMNDGKLPRYVVKGDALFTTLPVLFKAGDVVGVGKEDEEEGNEVNYVIDDSETMATMATVTTVTTTMEAPQQQRQPA